MPEKRATIAQISDLHINRKVKPSVIDMLKRLLQKIGPDVLVVSGDLANQPLPWQVKKAAQLVREIEESCKPTRVIVIPGNHDFKFWGNVGLRRLTRIPFEIYFRRDGLDRRILSCAAESVSLAFNALWWKGRAMREPVIASLFPERPKLGVAVFAVNSNTLAEMMAAGKVESRDLQDLYTKLDEAEKSPEFAFCYKIAVVHHHPAPIADAPTDSIARIQDSFLVFYNAGLFIRELSRRGFNLVLHGHKHVAGFLRIGCDFADMGRTTLPIAAAGTASHPAPDDSRGHHLHVIEIFDDDTARLNSWFFSADVERKDESCYYELDTLVMAFDEDSQRLKFICSNTEPKAIPTGDFFAGEGCAGFAFEKARCILYHPARDPIGYFIHQHEWPTGERVHESVVLSSFPWIHNAPDDQAMQDGQAMLVVGVVNVSSYETRTKLLGLFDAPENQRASMMKKLQDLANLAARRLL